MPDNVRMRAHLEAQVRRQAAEIGQLREAVHRLEHANAVLRAERDEARAERDALRAELTATRAQRDALQGELDQLRRQHAELRQQLADLVHALTHADERLRALVRREYGAASERLIADDGYIPEILRALREQEAGIVLAPTAAGEVPAADAIGATTASPDAGASGTGAVTGAAPAAAAASGAQAGAAAPASPSRTGRRRPPTAGGRKPLPEDIERRHRDYVPPPDHPALRHALDFDTIGSTTIERWHIGKLDLHIESIRCPVVRLQLRGGIASQQTLTPPAVVERGQVSDELLVRSAVDKVVDHLPAYRQEQRALRLGAVIPRAKLCRWHIALACFLRDVAQAVFDEIVQSPVVGIDDTVHRRQVADRRRCRQARLWAVTAPAGVFYLYTPTREGAWIASLLEGYRGGVMGDAYAGHALLLAREDIIALACWAHVRRKFFDAADTHRRRAMLELIAELYAIEPQIAASPPAERVFVRSARATPILARIKDQLDRWHADPAVLPGSGIGRATAYARKLWPSLQRYVTTGAAPIDNNATERAMRPVAMHRKNSLFSASDAGAAGYATLLTLTQTALLHDLDPAGYLIDIIQDLHFGRRPPGELTPSAYARRAAAERAKPS